MAYLIIGSWTTKCSECGGNACMDDTSHIKGGLHTAYDKGSSLDDRNGCGVVFDAPAYNEYAALEL